jgi:hypothetical protein
MSDAAFGAQPPTVGRVPKEVLAERRVFVKPTAILPYRLACPMLPQRPYTAICHREMADDPAPQDTVLQEQQDLRERTR